MKDKIELLRVRTDGFRHFWFKSTVESFSSLVVYFSASYSLVQPFKQPDISGGRGPYKISKSTLSGKDWFYRFG